MASLQARLIEWAVRVIGVKARLGRMEGRRDRILKGRPKDPRPPKSLYRRYHVEERSSDGLRTFTLAPRTRSARAQVFYLHGGAYVAEIADVQWKLLANLMDRAEIAATVPLYPLAPESTCEAALAFVLAEYEACQAAAGTLPVVLLGDSAGGGMVLALAQVLRDTGKPLPAGIVMLSPWLDVTCSDPGQPERERLDPILPLAKLRQDGLWYAGALAPTDPRVSPIFGNVDGLPPMLVLAGTHDVLYEDALRLRANAPDRLRFIEGPEMLHVWPAMPIPEAKVALEQVAGFLLECVDAAAS